MGYRSFQLDSAELFEAIKAHFDLGRLPADLAWPLHEPVFLTLRSESFPNDPVDIEKFPEAERLERRRLEPLQRPAAQAEGPPAIRFREFL